MKMKQDRKKLFAGAIVCILLGVAFLFGDQTPPNTEPEQITLQQSVQTAETAKQAEVPAPTEKMVAADTVQEQKKEVPVTVSPAKTEETLQTHQEPDALKCTLSVRCDAVLKNMNMLAAEKQEIIPKDGIMFKEQTVTFEEGESVFDLLLREMKKNNIHLEFVNTPMYDSAYIEGIGNLYEFDCGDCSGWMYRVNGTQPTYGCSQYKLQNGDKVEFFYSCNLFDKTQ